MIIKKLWIKIYVLATSKRQPLEVVAENLAKRSKGASWWDHARFTTRIVTPRDIREYNALGPEQRFTLRSAARFAASFYAPGEVAMYTFVMSALVAITAQAYITTKQPPELLLPIMSAVVAFMGIFLLTAVASNARDVAHAKTWEQAFDEAEARKAPRVWPARKGTYPGPIARAFRRRASSPIDVYAHRAPEPAEPAPLAQLRRSAVVVRGSANPSRATGR